MSKCKHFTGKEPDLRENCANCKRWNGECCRDEEKIVEEYETSEDFDFFDRLMRSNKGVVGPL